MFAALAAVLLEASAPAPGVADVTVRVAGVRDARGQVRVEICSARTWLKAGCEFTLSTPAQAGETVVVIPDVPAGVWAVQAYHDRNGNKEVDRGPLGLPVEEIGFSNQPPVGLKGPAFARAAFTHRDGAEVRVRLKRYWGP